MSKLVRRVSPQKLQAWNVPTDSKIDYYDGKFLIVSDADEEAPFGIAAKAGTSLLFGIAVFTHAPLVGVVCAAYAAYKVTETVRGLYGGENTLTTRLEQDLGIVTEAAPIGTATKLGEIEVNQPTSDEVKEVGEILCDRLAGQKTVLQQIAQRVAAQDIQGGLKMAIESAGLTPASFTDQFPGKGHVYDWAAGAIAAVIPSSEKAQTIGEYIDSTKPDRDVESAVKQAQSVTVPTKADILKMPLNDRANYLLKLLAEYGCDLRNLLGRPTLAGGGLQRSGKTTLILLVAIFEKALGNKIFYISRDNDLYPIAFDGYANGSMQEAIFALFALSRKINSGSMGSLTGETWVLDEFSSIAGELGKNEQREFWGMALTGFAKQGGRVRFMVHHKTAGANGLPPGQAETFKAEVKMLWTDRTELSDGTYQPSGQYELLQEDKGYYKESGQTFQIPEWLLTETNPAWHNAPCPVRSLLLFFPEFDTRKGAIAHPLNESKPKDPFKSTQVVSAQPTATQSEPTDDPWQCEEAEISESYTFPSDPGECVKLAAKLVQESGIASASEIEQLVPGLSKYLPTVVLFYSECTRNKEVYKWTD